MTTSPELESSIIKHKFIGGRPVAPGRIGALLLGAGLITATNWYFQTRLALAE